MGVELKTDRQIKEELDQKERDFLKNREAEVKKMRGVLERAMAKVKEKYAKKPS